MGPNGSGKSTLTNAIAGKDSYSIDKGEILYNDKLINDLNPEERAEREFLYLFNIQLVYLELIMFIF